MLLGPDGIAFAYSVPKKESSNILMGEYNTNREYLVSFDADKFSELMIRLENLELAARIVFGAE